MGDRLQSEIDRILKHEILHIEENSKALLFPQSAEAESIYARYISSTEEDRVFNHNISSAPIFIEEKIIPTFEEFVFKRLTEHGYNKSRFDQILLNNRSVFEDSDQFDPNFHKFCNDLENICNVSASLAKKLLELKYDEAKGEIELLKNRFPKYFPEKININPFEAKPGIFGFSVDLFALYRWIKQFVFSKSKKT